MKLDDNSLKSPNEESSNRTLSPGKGGRSLRKEMISYFILYHMLFFYKSKI